MNDRTRGDYGPRMTKAMEKQLRAEIAAFDKQKTLKDIEENAVGKKDIELENLLHNSDPRTNPDLVSDDKQIPWGGNSDDADVIEARKQIRQLLPFRQFQVWELVMRKGMSITRASERLGISHQNVSAYLQKAKAKIKAHYSENG